MRTLDDQIKPGGSVWKRLRDDMRLLWRVRGMIFGYFTAGARIRRAYRAKEAAGETFWVDE